MTEVQKLYLMIHQEEGLGQLVGGPSPAAAVQAHYDEMDMWCAPAPDAEVSEEFLVRLYEVPASHEREVRERFEDLDSDEFSREAADYIAENPSMTGVDVNVVYTAAEGATASEMSSLPNLLDRLDER